MKLRIGLPTLRGDIARYATRFDALEILAEPGRLPRMAALRKWREIVSDEFVFIVVLPQAVSALSADLGPSSFDYVNEVASALRASWVLMRTPPSVTPSAAMRRRLAELVTRVRPICERIAWEPRGVWNEGEVDVFARDLGVHVVRDGTREELPSTPVVYTRLRALGVGTHLGADALERLAIRLMGRSEALVIVEGEGAGRARQSLEGLLGELAEIEDE